MEQQIEDKNIKVNLKVSDDFIIETDENFLSIILRNLLQNAIKYSDSGSIISISSKGRILYVSNPTLKTNAAVLNDVLSNRKIDSKTSGQDCRL